MRNPTRLALLLALAGLIPACGAGSTGARGLQGPAGPSALVIQSLSAVPPVVAPGQSSIFSVSATSGAGGTPAFAWIAGSGGLSSPSGNPVTWTAPDTVGTATIQVTVTDGTGASAVGVLSILVSAGPTGPVITSVNPGRVHRGDEILITGGTFGATQGSGFVTISGVPADIHSWSDHSIRALVPNAAVPGEVVVTIGGQDSSPGLLDVLVDDNFVIGGSSGKNTLPQIVSDGAGGSIVIWVDGDPLLAGIYGQRFDSTGIPQWSLPAALVFPQSPNDLMVIPDGSGGAIVAFSAYRGGLGFDIAVQRIDGSGTPLWGATGVTVCAAAGDQFYAQVASDGAGGAIVCWDDLRTGVTFDVFSQRVNGAGAPQWAADGVPVLSGASIFNFALPRITADGFGGAIIAWADSRSSEYDIYGQRLNSAGVAQWAANGIVIGGEPLTYQASPLVLADGTGGAFLAWLDARLGSFDIFAQRINGSGTQVWTAGGVAVCTAINDQYPAEIVLDAAGGMIVLWQDFRSGGAGADYYAQRLDGSGAEQWTAGGVVVTQALGLQSVASMIADGAGGAIVVWQDARFGDPDIYGQRLDSTGAALWGPDGAVICSADQDQVLPRLISDGSGGALVVWKDTRDRFFGDPDRADLYLQFIDGAGVRY